MSDNMTKRAKEYMNADFVYEDYKNLAEAQKIADVEDVTAISERLIKQNMAQLRKSAQQVKEGKIITKTMEDLEAIACE